MRKVSLWLLLFSAMITISCRKSPEESGYQLNPTADNSAPNGIYIPKDIDDAHRELEKMLPEEVIAKMRKNAHEDMALYHFGLGMWMRNNWGLWKGSRLSKYFNELGVHHPDDMSGIILDTFWCYLNDEPQNLQKRISEIQEYWKSMEKPKEGSPIDDATIAWLITLFPQEGRNDRVVHLGLSVSDKTGWRYEYGSGKGIEPATSEEDLELDHYREGFNLEELADIK